MTLKKGGIIDIKSIAGSLIVAIVCGGFTFYTTTTNAKATTDIEIKQLKDTQVEHLDESKKLIKDIYDTLHKLDKASELNTEQHKGIKTLIENCREEIKELRS